MSFRSVHERRFNEIIESYGRFLRLTILRACPRDLGISFDEIEQDAHLRLWKALESEREIQDMTSYLYRIAVTATLDAVRRVKRKREEQLLEEIESDNASAHSRHQAATGSAQAPDRKALRKQIIAKVQTAVASLPDNRRQAVTLHLGGMTTQEVADSLGWTEAKARNLIYRGLENVRECLRKEGIDYEIE